MLLFVHDNQLQRMALVDSTKDGMLTFYDDEWHRYLKEATSTFDFTVPKNGADGLQYINEKSYISFRDGTGRDHLFTIVKVEESDTEIKLYTEECNLELLNETAPAYTSDGAHSFEEYFKMQWLIGTGEISGMAIGINEIGDYKRAVSWDGSSTKLERLRSLANRFDAEIEFQTKLNADGTIKAILVNVYRKHSDRDQGVGTRREDKTLYYGEELTSVRRTVDKTELYTAISPIGTDGLRIQGEHVEKDSNGNTLYYSTGGIVIYAPLAAQKYPAINSKGDPWILLADWSYETKDPKTLYSQGLAKLKAVSEPSIQYEIKGTQELEIGDTVTIHDKMYDPALIIEARVSEQIISFTDPTKSENTYANIRALESKVSKSLQNRALELAEDAKDKADIAIAKAKAAADQAEEQKASIKEVRGAAEEAKTVATTAKEETKNLRNLIRETEEGITLGKSEDGLTYSTPYVELDASGSYKIKDTSDTTLMQLSGNALNFDGGAVRIGQSSGAHLEMYNEHDYLDGEMKNVSSAFLMSEGSSSLFAINGKHIVTIEAHSANEEAEIIAKRINFRDLSDPTSTSVGGTVEEWKEAFEGGRNAKNLEVKIKDEFRELLESVLTSISELKAKTDDTKDYVIDQHLGASRSNWSWRKWKSGLCEMWVLAPVNSTSGWARVGSSELWKYTGHFNLPIKLTALEDVQLTTDWDGWVTSDSENPNHDSLGQVWFSIFQPSGSDGLDKAHSVRVYVRGRLQ